MDSAMRVFKMLGGNWLRGPEAGADSSQGWKADRCRRPNLGPRPPRNSGSSLFLCPHDSLTGARIAVVATGVVVALAVAVWFLKQRAPDLKGAWENSLGMKFAPVPGTEALFCIWETRVKDFRAFVSDRAGNNGYDYSQGKDAYVLKADGWKQRGPEYGWNNPGFEQGDDHPVTCMSHDDATRFCAWLTARERRAGTIGLNQAYRLPRDWEWSVAVGLNEPKGGTPEDKAMKAPGYPWGDGEKPPARWGNYASEEARDRDWPSGYDGVIARYNDGYPRTSPVGVFGAKHGALCDLGGNVWEWCEDWYESNQTNRVLRGDSWSDYNPWCLLSSYRDRGRPGVRGDNYGFRVVLSSCKYKASP